MRVGGGVLASPLDSDACPVLRKPLKLREFSWKIVIEKESEKNNRLLGWSSRNTICLLVGRTKDAQSCARCKVFRYFTWEDLGYNDITKLSKWLYFLSKMNSQESSSDLLFKSGPCTSISLLRSCWTCRISDPMQWFTLHYNLERLLWLSIFVLYERKLKLRTLPRVMELNRYSLKFIEKGSKINFLKRKSLVPACLYPLLFWES